MLGLNLYTELTMLTDISYVRQFHIARRTVDTHNFHIFQRRDEDISGNFMEQWLHLRSCESACRVFSLPLTQHGPARHTQPD